MQVVLIVQLLLILAFCLIAQSACAHDLIISNNYLKRKRRFLSDSERPDNIYDYIGNYDSDYDDASTQEDHDDDGHINFRFKSAEDPRCGTLEPPPSSLTSEQGKYHSFSHVERRIPEGWQFFGTLLGEQDSLVCGATVVSPNIVVTSRTCGYNITANNGANSLRIILGDWIRNENFTGKVVWSLIDCAATTYTIRPSINGAYRSSDDFMMIKFDERLKFSDRFQPACLDGPSEKMEDFDRCLAIGHGNNGSATNLEVQSEEVESVECWQEDESQFCFKSKENPSWSTCLNDSGGPIICFNNTISRWQLIGIVSTVQDKCDQGNSIEQNGIYNVAVKFRHIYTSDIWKNCSNELSKDKLFHERSNQHNNNLAIRINSA